jgi:hypothetical protein
MFAHLIDGFTGPDDVRWAAALGKVVQVRALARPF